MAGEIEFPVEFIEFHRLAHGLGVVVHDISVPCIAWSLANPVIGKVGKNGRGKEGGEWERGIQGCLA